MKIRFYLVFSKSVHWLLIHTNLDFFWSDTLNEVGTLGTAIQMTFLWLDISQNSFKNRPFEIARVQLFLVLNSNAKASAWILRLTCAITFHVQFCSFLANFTIYSKWKIGRRHPAFQSRQMLVYNSIDRVDPALSQGAALHDLLRAFPALFFFLFLLFTSQWEDSCILLDITYSSQEILSADLLYNSDALISHLVCLSLIVDHRRIAKTMTSWSTLFDLSYAFSEQTTH